MRTINAIITRNTIDTNDISFHGVRSVGQSRTLKELMQGFQQGFHCVKQSGFKGPYIC